MKNECFIIHVGSSSDIHDSINNDRITKLELVKILEKDNIIIDESYNCCDVEEVKEIICLIDNNSDTIPIWGEGRSKDLRRNSLVLLVSTYGLEYLGKVSFKVSSASLSKKMWGGFWKYQYGVKDVFKFRIPMDELKRILSIKKTDRFQSSRKLKYSEEELLDIIWKYSIETRFEGIEECIYLGD